MRKKLLLFLLLFTCMFFMTGCTIKKNIKNTVSNKQVEKKIDLVGKYYLIEFQEGKKVYTKKELDDLKDHGMEVVLELKSDKTGTIKIFDDTKNFKYNNKKIFINNDEFSFSTSNDILIFKKNNSTMKFKKIEKKNE